MPRKKLADSLPFDTPQDTLGVYCHESIPKSEDHAAFIYLQVHSDDTVFVVLESRLSHRDRFVGWYLVGNPRREARQDWVKRETVNKVSIYQLVDDELPE